MTPEAMAQIHTEEGKCTESFIERGILSDAKRTKQKQRLKRDVHMRVTWATKCSNIWLNTSGCVGEGISERD